MILSWKYDEIPIFWKYTLDIFESFSKQMEDLKIENENDEFPANSIQYLLFKMINDVE